MSEPRQTYLMGLAHAKIDGHHAFITENGFYNISTPALFTGNGTKVILPAVTPGDCLIIKGITIIAEGNQGTVKLFAGDRLILPLYVSNFSRSTTSPALNLKVAYGEELTAVLAGRGATEETFVGITYYECRT